MNRILVLIICLIGSVAAAEPIVDITKFAGQSEDRATGYLGAPTTCSKSKHGKKCLYRKGDTEIVYIGGIADWITVGGSGQIPFSKSGLTALGLKEEAPSFSNEFVIRWTNIPGFLEISLFEGSSSADYAYIKVKTK